MYTLETVDRRYHKPPLRGGQRTPHFLTKGTSITWGRIHPSICAENSYHQPGNSSKTKLHRSILTSSEHVNRFFATVHSFATDCCVLAFEWCGRRPDRAGTQSRAQVCEWSPSLVAHRSALFVSCEAAPDRSHVFGAWARRVARPRVGNSSCYK